MPEKSDESQATKKLQHAQTKLHNSDTKKKILDAGNFTAIPNRLRSAWRKGIVSSGCFDLVCETLEHAESFHLKEAYLLTIFANDRSLKKATEEAIARKMVRIEKVRVGRSTINVWHSMDPNGWILETLSPVEDSPPQNQGCEPSDSPPLNSPPQIRGPQIRGGLTRRIPNNTKENNNNNKASTINKVLNLKGKKELWMTKICKELAWTVGGCGFDFTPTYHLLGMLGEKRSNEALNFLKAEGYSHDRPFKEHIQWSHSDEDLCEYILNLLNGDNMAGNSG